MARTSGHLNPGLRGAEGTAARCPSKGSEVPKCPCTKQCNHPCAYRYAHTKLLLGLQPSRRSCSLGFQSFGLLGSGRTQCFALSVAHLQDPRQAALNSSVTSSMTCLGMQCVSLYISTRLFLGAPADASSSNVKAAESLRWVGKLSHTSFCSPLHVHI